MAPSPDTQTPRRTHTGPQPAYQVLTASPGCRLGAVGESTGVTWRPHSCLSLGGPSAWAGVPQPRDRGLSVWEGPSASAAGPSAWAGVYRPEVGVHQPEGSTSLQRVPGSRLTPVPHSCAQRCPQPARPHLPPHSGGVPPALWGQPPHPQLPTRADKPACRVSAPVTLHTETPRHPPRALPGRDRPSYPQAREPRDNPVPSRVPQMRPRTGHLHLGPSPAPCPRAHPGRRGTFVSSIEDVRQLTGTLEVEECSHGEDEARADEKRPQEEGGCHVGAPCKRGEGCQGCTPGLPQGPRGSHTGVWVPPALKLPRPQVLRGVGCQDVQ